MHRHTAERHLSNIAQLYRLIPARLRHSTEQEFYRLVPVRCFHCDAGHLPCAASRQSVGVLTAHLRVRFSDSAAPTISHVCKYSLSAMFPPATPTLTWAQFGHNSTRVPASNAVFWLLVAGLRN